MSTPYQRGAAFEHRVKAELEEAGWLVTRSPGSKSSFDLLALPPKGKQRFPVLVQCKLNGVIGPADRETLRAIALAYNALPVLAYTLKPRGVVHYRQVFHRPAEMNAWSP